MGANAGSTDTHLFCHIVIEELPSHTQPTCAAAAEVWKVSAPHRFQVSPTGRSAPNIRLPSNKAEGVWSLLQLHSFKEDFFKNTFSALKTFFF